MLLLLIGKPPKVDMACSPSLGICFLCLYSLTIDCKAQCVCSKMAFGLALSEGTFVGMPEFVSSSSYVLLEIYVFMSMSRRLASRRVR